jgi:hypothetical protein
MPRFFLTCAILFAFAAIAAAWESKHLILRTDKVSHVSLTGKKPPPEPKSLPGVEVVLRFSVEELDPLKPDKSFVECIVHNQSPKAIQVPSGLAGGFDTDMTLTSGDRSFGLRLVMWAGDKNKETKLLKPGAAMTIFKDSLRNVLLLDEEKVKPLTPKEERYYWTWNA